MSEPTRLDALRCADQDRETVAALLNTAYADGRLTFEEHADRIALAYDAKTFGDLNTLTTDLVAFESPSPAPRPAQTPAPSSYPPPMAQSTHQPVSMPTVGVPATTGAFTGGNALLSTFNPGRVALVAGELSINAWLGEARLDLIGAAFERRDTTVRISSGMGEVKIRVPEGVEVNLSGLTLIMGEAKVRGLVPRPDGIRLNLVGTLIMGEVKIVGPDMDQRKYERFIR